MAKAITPKALAAAVLREALPGKADHELIEMQVSSIRTMLESVASAAISMARDQGKQEDGADPLPLLYANADAASRLWLAVIHAIHGLNTVAMQMTEQCSPDDDSEGYASLAHTLVGHLRHAADSFERGHTDTYGFPAEFKRPEVDHEHDS
jgi:hypothetical protein